VGEGLGKEGRTAREWQEKGLCLRGKRGGVPSTTFAKSNASLILGRKEGVSFDKESPNVRKRDPECAGRGLAKETPFVSSWKKKKSLKKEWTKKRCTKKGEPFYGGKKAASIPPPRLRALLRGM